MKTIILGKGLMGSELAHQTQWDCVCRRDDKIDILNPASYEQYVRDYGQVINCIGYTNTRHPFKDPAWSTNYIGVIDLVDKCNKYGTKLVHISTDYVYANSIDHAKEDDIPIHYQNWYAYSKLLADGYIEAKCRDYLIIRTSYKVRPFPYPGAWEHLTGNFDYVDVIASMIVSLINKGASGIYNVGTKSKTMYQLAVQTSPDVEPMDGIVMPSNVTMNLSKVNRILAE